MSENIQNSSPTFKLAQDLGLPTIPPIIPDKWSVSVQFIVPGLKLGNQDKNKVYQLVKKCGIDIYKIEAQLSQNERTKEPATLFTIAFYVNSFNNKEEKTTILNSASRLLIERFIGLLSFFIGIKLSAINIQYTTTDNVKTLQKILPVSSKSLRLPIKVELPEITENSQTLPEDIFSALFWLRRGLSERDPIENYSALMICIQIMARHLVNLEPNKKSCPSCGAELETQPPSITLLTRTLLVSKLGAPDALYERLWKARNAIVAHGNIPITAEVFLELTDLKFEAANLAFKSIKLGLGMPLDSPPSPNPSYFITDAFMHVD